MNVSNTLAAMRARIDARPPDDEPLSPETVAAIEAARNDPETITDNEVRVMIGREPRSLPGAQMTLLRAKLQMGNTRAIAKVVGVIRRADGNMQAAAKALGISERTLYAWRDKIPALGAEIAKVARGRIGRPVLSKSLKAANDLAPAERKRVS